MAAIASRARRGPWGWTSATRSDFSAKAANRSTGGMSDALRFGKQAQERMRRDVPAFVQEEMRKARNELLDLKVRGNNLSRPISILKDASALVKRESWGDALRQIREFHKAVQTLE